LVFDLSSQFSYQINYATKEIIMSIIFESPESSSPIITRTVSNGLLGIGTEIYNFPKTQKIALRMIGHLPKQVAEWLVPIGNSLNAFSVKDVINIRTKDLINERLKDYDKNPGKYPAITVGIGMGGTTAHIALGLGGPFLPQAFVLTLQNGTINGDVNEYFNLGHSTALNITKNNPDLMTIQHYDPDHDGWLVRRVNYLRLKLIKLPTEYINFIKEKLMPGGDIVYLEGKAEWKRYKVGERNVFQIGGWGDLSPEEYINGSERLTNFSKREKLDYDHWKLEGYPLEDGPESEWGSEPGLGEALEQFCKEEGFNFIKISSKDPNDFTRLAFYSKLKLLEKENITPSGIVIEMFSQFDAFTINQTALLPLWLIFNTNDSLRFLKEMTKEFPKDKPVFFSSLATFTKTPDLVPWNEWEETLNGFDMVNIGTRKSHYPSDALALLDWKKPLLKWAKDNRCEFTERITGNMLKEIADKIIGSAP
jgi:hypothetical protein